MKQTETLQLIRPNVLWEAAHQEMIKDWESTGEKLVPFIIKPKYVGTDFAAYIKKMENYSNGIDLGTMVAHSTFWLVNEARQILGVSNLRHDLPPKLLERVGHIGGGVAPSQRRKGYATKILALTLLEAKKMGIDKVVVNCDKENIYSAQTIIKNGGELWKETVVEGVTIQNYWITIG